MAELLVVLCVLWYIASVQHGAAEARPRRSNNLVAIGSLAFDFAGMGVKVVDESSCRTKASEHKA